MTELPHSAAPPSPHAPSLDNEEDGDLSMIRWLMSLTVNERLVILQTQANSLSKLRDACSEG